MILENEIKLLKLLEVIDLGEDIERAKAFQELVIVGKREGIHFASTKKLLYEAREGKFSIPALNVRTLSVDFSRLIHEMIISLGVRGVIFEISITEQKYTNQTPLFFAASILIGAILARYKGEIYLQADHTQFNRSKWILDSNEEMKKLQGILQEMVSVGFYNLDIDGSTLVDYVRPTIKAQQKDNLDASSQLLKYLADIQIAGVELSVGVEIGHIGDRNSTPSEIKYFVSEIAKYKDLVSKIAVQTGTEHGGKIDENGNVVEMPVDFELIKRLGKSAQEAGLAGIVQHGASTLPLGSLAKLPAHGVVEVHLATAWQNIFFENLPQELKSEMEGYVRENFLDELQDVWSASQAQYRLRKKALGPFRGKIEALKMEQKQPILDAWRNYATQIFTALKVRRR